MEPNKASETLVASYMAQLQEMASLVKTLQEIELQDGKSKQVKKMWARLTTMSQSAPMLIAGINKAKRGLLVMDDQGNLIDKSLTMGPKPKDYSTLVKQEQ